MSTSGESPGDPGLASRYLTFNLGDELFGMDIRTVREIIQYGPISTLPLMPAFVRGVINLRGAVLPVIDLQARFGRVPAAVDKKTCIVIFDALRGGERVGLGLLVDAVSAVVGIAPSEVEPAPDFGAVIQRDLIRGIGKVGPRFVVILEPERAFDVDEMTQLCEHADTGAVA